MSVGFLGCWISGSSVSCPEGRGWSFALSLIPDSCLLAAEAERSVCCSSAVAHTTGNCSCVCKGEVLEFLLQLDYSSESQEKPFSYPDLKCLNSFLLSQMFKWNQPGQSLHELLVTVDIRHLFAHSYFSPAPAFLFFLHFAVAD